MTDASVPASTPHRSTAVAIVGAGISGLIAARELSRSGVDVLVVEAAGRVGGRTMAVTTSLGSTVDLGGQWIGHGHHRFEALAAEVGASTYAMHTPKRPAILDGDKEVGQASSTSLVANAVLVAWEIAAKVGAPSRWRDKSVQQWISKVPSAGARRLLEVLVSVSTCAELDELSMHAFASFIKYQGGLTTMMATSGGAQDSLVVQGAGHLAQAVAAELGDRVLLDTAVTVIDRDDSGVTLQTSSGEIRAAKVVVTVPPPMARRIVHRPELPAQRAELERTMYMGSVYKAIAVYHTPFWRDVADAEAVTLAGTGAAVFDTTPPGGPGHLCILVAGPQARALDDLTEEQRRTALLEPLAKRLGADICKPVDWYEKSWHTDEFAGGGYSALPLMGDGDGYYPISAEPVGHVHWAGTETASEHAGYIEGAIESGERVAREVAGALV